MLPTSFDKEQSFGYLNIAPGNYFLYGKESEFYKESSISPTMKHIFDSSAAVRELRRILQRAPDTVSLEDLIFVGNEPGPKTVQTLPGSFPHGDARYDTYLITMQEKKKGKSIAEIR